MLAGFRGAPLDEDGALQLGQPAEERPSGDLRLGDERSRQERSEHLYIEIGGVVGDDQHRARLRQAAADAHPDAENAADEAVIGHGQAARQGQPEHDRNSLNRQQRDGQGKIAQHSQAGARGRTHGAAGQASSRRGAPSSRV